MAPDGRDDGPGDAVARSAYSSRRKRSRSRLRMGALALFVTGCLVVGITLLNLHAPGTWNPVGLDAGPVLGLGVAGGAGGILIAVAVVVYAYARRTGI